MTWTVSVVILIRVRAAEFRSTICALLTPGEGGVTLPVNKMLRFIHDGPEKACTSTRRAGCGSGNGVTPGSGASIGCSTSSIPMSAMMQHVWRAGRGILLCVVVALLLFVSGCGRQSDYQSGYDEGYGKALRAGGSRIPTPAGRSAEYQRGFEDGWREGLKKNPRLNSEKDEGP
jgi:hypothetical protein